MEGQDGREKGVGDDDPVGEGVHRFGGEILLGPGLEFSERCREDVADSDISAKEDAEVFGRVARLDGPWLGDHLFFFGTHRIY